MTDYNSIRERTKYYAQATGLSVRSVNDYRRTPVNDWTTRRERKIGSTIRGLERLWLDVDVAVELWSRIAKTTLRAISDFLHELIDTVDQLAIRVADAIDRGFVWFAGTLEKAEAWIEKHPNLKLVLQVMGYVGNLRR